MKEKLRKPTKQKQNHRYGEHWGGGQWEGVSGRMEEKVKGLSTNWALAGVAQWIECGLVSQRVTNSVAGQVP